MQEGRKEGGGAVLAGGTNMKTVGCNSSVRGHDLIRRGMHVGESWGC